MIDLSNPGAIGIQISNDGKKIWVCVNGVSILRAQGIEYLQLDDMRNEPIEMGNDPITLFEGMEIDPTLSLLQMCGILRDREAIFHRVSESNVLKILDTTADPQRYFNLEFAIPAVGQQAQRLIKITEYRQTKLWIMP